jgi:hypothetical protein
MVNTQIPAVKYRIAAKRSTGEYVVIVYTQLPSGAWSRCEPRCYYTTDLFDARNTKEVMIRESRLLGEPVVD